MICFDLDHLMSWMVSIWLYFGHMPESFAVFDGIFWFWKYELAWKWTVGEVLCVISNPDTQILNENWVLSLKYRKWPFSQFTHPQLIQWINQDLILNKMSIRNMSGCCCIVCMCCMLHVDWNIHESWWF